MATKDNERTEKEKITEPELSFDRFVILLRSPQLSMFNFDKEDIIDYCAEQEDKERRINGFINRFKTTFGSSFQKGFTGERGSHLYKYHFRLVGACDGYIDVQICPVFGKKSKIIDKELNEIETGEVDQEGNKKTEYEIVDSDFGIRLEGNETRTDLGLFKGLFAFFGYYLNTNFDEMIKISRLDIAIDYPRFIMPNLIDIIGSRLCTTICGNTGLQTMYFGSRNSAYHWCIYDKKRQL